ncbi:MULTISPECIES: hypothetical protein [Microbacterium]|nr:MULTISPECIES: hypothetical protein [Microbacterium]
MEMYGEWLADSVRESLAAGSCSSRMRSPVAGASDPSGNELGVWSSH